MRIKSYMRHLSNFALLIIISVGLVSCGGGGGGDESDVTISSTFTCTINEVEFSCPNKQAFDMCAEGDTSDCTSNLTCSSEIEVMNTWGASINIQGVTAGIIEKVYVEDAVVISTPIQSGNSKTFSVPDGSGPLLDVCVDFESDAGCTYGKVRCDEMTIEVAPVTGTLGIYSSGCGCPQ